MGVGVNVIEGVILGVTVGVNEGVVVGVVVEDGEGNITSIHSVQEEYDVPIPKLIISCPLLFTFPTYS